MGRNVQRNAPGAYVPPLGQVRVARKAGNQQVVHGLAAFLHSLNLPNTQCI